jgi:DNA-binding XRE family transcriptional regulator
LDAPVGTALVPFAATAGTRLWAADPNKPQPIVGGDQVTEQGQSRWTTAIDGELLRRMRRQRGLSQERLADLAKVSVRTVVRLERPSMQPCRTWTLFRIANVLEQQPDPPGDKETGETQR